MRLLLYIVALLTGFSAAEAARPVETASATTASSQVELAEAFAGVASAASVQQFNVLELASNRHMDARPVAVPPAVEISATPVSRADIARE